MNIKLLSFLLYFIFFSCYGQKLTIAADEWAGYTNADGTGIYFELLKRIYSENQIDLKIDIFNRASKNFKLDKADILVGVYREDVQHAIIPKWYLDVDAPVTAFYQPDHTKIANISDLDNLLVAWHRGYKFDNFINNKSPYLVNSTAQGFKLLKKNRIDVFVDYSLNISEKYSSIFSSIEIMPPRRLYVAFQKNKHGAALAKQFDLKMAELRESGELKSIFSNQYAHTNFDDFNDGLDEVLILTTDINLTHQNENKHFNLIESNLLYLTLDYLDNYNVNFKMMDDLLDIEHYKNEPKTCINNMIKTASREKDFIFSQPTALYLGLRLFSKHQLHPKKSLDLTELLLADKNATLGIPSGKSYGTSIEKQLNLIPKQQTINTPLNSLTELKMLNDNSFDYMLGHPATIDVLWPVISNDKLYSYEIKGAHNYVLSYLMCSKTASNKAFVKAFNKALTKSYKNKDFLDIHNQSVSIDNQKRFNQYFKQVFKTH